MRWQGLALAGCIVLACVLQALVIEELFTGEQYREFVLIACGVGGYYIAHRAINMLKKIRPPPPRSSPRTAAKSRFWRWIQRKNRSNNR